MSDVEWAGRTFGQLDPDEKRRAAKAAGDQLTAELASAADAISAVLDQPLPGEIGKGDIVRFRAMADPLNGDESPVTVEGVVFRKPWGRALNLSIRTLEDKPRTFVRGPAEVEIIRKATP